ncbi:MAG: GNAT family N-acetyltransferase [Saprospiraceae bacterium]|nr:GNAT family N-acetyltransferase [Saprospiraceae bacterium]MDZ4706297.1 GNAT family N-acetyltransferase [Saprospiraceae bacterium]
MKKKIPVLLETERLRIFPLSYAQLISYLENDQSLEMELALQFHPREVSPALKEAFDETILPAMERAGENYVFSTLWTVVLKDRQMMAGDLCFQGAPNEQGVTEIGYGSHELFQGKGIMTEAVGVLVAWAFQQPDVLVVVAETDPENIASQRILEKNGFRQTGVNGSHLCWRLDKP